MVHSVAQVCPEALLPETVAQSASSKWIFGAMFDFQAADQGEYQCLAESEAGTAERTITLKVQSEFFHMRNNHMFQHLYCNNNLCCLRQSTAATLTGKNGARVVAPVDKASRKESDCATTQNQPTGADRAAGPLPTRGNVTLDSVQVKQNV